jgi:hypothetical protein
MEFQQELIVFDFLTMPFYHPIIEGTLHAALLDPAETVEQKEPPLIGFEIQVKSSGLAALVGNIFFSKMRTRPVERLAQRAELNFT